MSKRRNRTSVISVSLPNELVLQLDWQAAKEDMSRTTYVVRAIRAALVRTKPVQIKLPGPPLTNDEDPRL
jgi:metal-responsive CopG/Arc/MetJ family transcriptional regulator